MSKELEALNKIKHASLTVEKHDATSGSITIIPIVNTEEYETIKSYLTPPTADEVCEALSEWYGAEVKHDYHQHDDINEVYMHDQFYFRQIKTDIDGKPYAIHKSIAIGSESRLSFNAYLPPHLITLIGRFYEGLEEELK